MGLGVGGGGVGVYLIGLFKAGLHHFLLLCEVSSCHAGRKGVWRHFLSWRFGGLEMVITHHTQLSQQPFHTVSEQEAL